MGLTEGTFELPLKKGYKLLNGLRDLFLFIRIDDF